MRKYELFYIIERKVLTNNIVRILSVLVFYFFLLSYISFIFAGETDIHSGFLSFTISCMSNWWGCTLLVALFLSLGHFIDRQSAKEAKEFIKDNFDLIITEEEALSKLENSEVFAKKQILIELRKNSRIRKDIV